MSQRLPQNATSAPSVKIQKILAPDASPTSLESKTGKNVINWRLATKTCSQAPWLAPRPLGWLQGDLIGSQTPWLAPRPFGWLQGDLIDSQRRFHTLLEHNHGNHCGIGEKHRELLDRMFVYSFAFWLSMCVGDIFYQISELSWVEEFYIKIDPSLEKKF